MPYRYLWILTGCLASVSAFAQPADDRISYAVESGWYAAGNGPIPFWLRTNQQGTVPLTGSLITARLNVSQDYRQRTDSSSRFDWGFGVNGVFNGQLKPAGEPLRYYLPDAFLKVRYGKFELFAGNRTGVIGIVDTLLSSGSVAWSGNTLPIPKVQLHTPDYISLGFLKHILAFRVGYAHGWFINSYVKNSYLHQKYAYFRLGKPHWRVRAYACLNHQVQWDGQAGYLNDTPLAVNGQLPATFRDYLSVVTGRYPEALQTDRFTDFDGTNRIGNHIGSIDLALEWRGDRTNWQLYHQHLYEDASGLALRNVPDGLTGLRLLNLNGEASSWFRIRRVVIEWLSTLNQSGPTFDPAAQYQGGDNYYNHSQYREGWTYQGLTLGTPFLFPNTNLSQYAAGLGGPYFPNNRVTAWYLALDGVIAGGPSLMFKASLSRNRGTFNRPYPEPLPQLSAYTAIRWPLNRRKTALLCASFAVDQGDLLPVSTGSYLGLHYAW
nr:capsule assembly Wzi family protein [uncultured Arsenicibacter sp.]